MASSKIAMLNSALDAVPEAMDPALSRTNHATRPANTVRRTPSGALSWTQACKRQIVHDA